VKTLVVVHLQVSSYGQDGIPCLLSDSNVVAGMNQALATLYALGDANPVGDPSADLVYALPSRVPGEDQEALRNLTVQAVKEAIGVTYPGVRFTHPEAGLSAMGDRFDFDLPGVVRFLQGEAQHDQFIIWANDPMKVIHWRAALHEAGIEEERVKVYTYISWWDNPPKAAVRYLPRQVEGLRLADKTFVNSWFAKELIERDAPWVGARVLRLLPLRYLWREERASRMPAPTLLYNHRVSSFPYYATPLETYAAVSEYVNENLEDPWHTVFTNPTGKPLANLYPYSPDELGSGHWELCERPPPPDEYARLLQSAWLTCCLFAEGAMWSMSVLDAIVSGTPVVYIANDGMAELWPFGEYPWAAKSLPEAQLKLRNLMIQMRDPKLRGAVLGLAEDLADMYRDSIIGTIRCNALHIGF
jgi:hypothetical protein